MRLVANKPMEYARVKYAKGGRFEASERDARVLIGIGHASQDLGDLPAPAIVPLVTEPGPELASAPKRRRGSYKTREMRAS